MVYVNYMDKSFCWLICCNKTNVWKVIEIMMGQWSLWGGQRLKALEWVNKYSRLLLPGTWAQKCSPAILPTLLNHYCVETRLFSIVILFLCWQNEIKAVKFVEVSDSVSVFRWLSLASAWWIGEARHWRQSKLYTAKLKLSCQKWSQGRSRNLCYGASARTFCSLWQSQWQSTSLV